MFAFDFGVIASQLIGYSIIQLSVGGTIVRIPSAIDPPPCGLCGQQHHKCEMYKSFWRGGYVWNWNEANKWQTNCKPFLVVIY